MAAPVRPEKMFVMHRTRSIGACVLPAVTRRFMLTDYTPLAVLRCFALLLPDAPQVLFAAVEDVAVAGRIDRHHPVIRKPGRHEEYAVVQHHAGDELLGGAVDDPDLFAGVRVVAGDALRTGEHELFLPGGFDHDWRAIGTQPSRP